MLRNKHQEKVKIANDTILKMIKNSRKDRFKPKFHACAPINWLNDPNGFIYYRGEYHLFYQHNPFKPSWGSIHWGHVKSKNLLHWEHLPVALAPSEFYDIDGCFSGSAIEKDGKIYAFYTANKCIGAEEMNTVAGEILQTQCLAISEDSINFRKHENNPLIKHAPDSGQNNHFRDPKVWIKNGKWYMILGTKKNNIGKVVLYDSVDLHNWKYIGVVSESTDMNAYMWECPDFFELGEKEMLIVSQQGIGDTNNPNISGYFLGHLNYNTAEFKHGTFSRLDYGVDFYAPQTTIDDIGRRILIGWLMMPINAPVDINWVGSMTLPRILGYSSKGKITIKPISEIKSLRREGKHFKNLVVKKGIKNAPLICGNSLEIIIEFDLKKCEAKEFGLNLRCANEASGKIIIKYDVNHSEVILDRSFITVGKDTFPKQKKARVDLSKCKIESSEEKLLLLHIFIDASILEVFINDGEYVMSGFIFLKSKELCIDFFASNAQVIINKMDVWKLY